ncbi:glutathione S-transferase family protein [Aliikangiella maris]|uniref:Glutathione S-transferase family protein n=2 Tax=Aliikangiella maris TaxID=3162458 RepID=A0ABV2BNP3_9GAMM
MSLQPIELISFSVCPYVQRSVITLLKKEIDFKISFIDLANKPDWFLKISPLGKVPVLKYGDTVIFESAVINEFLDEVTPSSLLPTDPLEKAVMRGWIEFSGQVLLSHYGTMIANTHEDFQKSLADLKSKLGRLEEIASDNATYFNGQSFTLLDSAIAPLFVRLNYYLKYFQIDVLSDFPKLNAISRYLCAQSYVQKSVDDKFDNDYRNYLASKNSILLQ